MVEIFEFLAPGILAAGVAWCGNRSLLNFFSEEKVAVFFAPALEELAKTGFAVLLGAPVLPSHLIFGLLEALRDLAGSGARGPAAGLAGLAGHAAFGLAASLVLSRSGFFPLAAAAGWVLHFGWNAFVFRLK